MDKDEEILKNRIRDLADRCYNNNIYTFSDFLGLSELSAYYSLQSELKYVPSVVYGGYDGCERAILRFGNPDFLGYAESFPISILKISPLMAKFADKLSHRDVLGSLMNLGIKREVLGDIIIDNNTSYVFCLESIADYICENLTRIKHTSVICRTCDILPEEFHEDINESVIQVQSLRVDGIISKVHNLSRSSCNTLFAERKIFINGRCCENNSLALKDGDIVTVRGYGRFTLIRCNGISKKGKLNLTITKQGK